MEPEYDDFAETYQRWSVAESPYRVVELYNFFDVLGPVRGLDVLDLACGAGRASRLLMERGAASVVGGDVSPEMIQRAARQNAPDQSMPADAPQAAWEKLRYIVLDARDPAFRLDRPADLVTAMYLFHYAPTADDLQRMADLIAHNVKPGGRFVTYTISPDYDFGRPEPLMMARCGFDYAVVEGRHCELIIGEERVDIWQWSREDQESCLRRAGLDETRWHPLRPPPNTPAVAEAMDFYIANPSCIVLSARKPH